MTIIKSAALAALIIGEVFISCSKDKARPSDNINPPNPIDTIKTPVEAEAAPPERWKEHWFEHNQNLTRVYYDSVVAVYYDSDVKRSITWPYKVMGDVWRYTKKTYGDFGTGKRLYVIFHAGKYSGGHPASYFDASHDNRNVVDMGSSDFNAWQNPTGTDIAIPIHEVGHIVEGASKGIKNSPSFPLWGDSKWMEIYIYDVLLALDKKAEADKIYNEMQTQTDDFPRAGSQWFKNWFYPIYSKYGGATVLNKYFVLLAANFPKNGKEYSRDLNWGEFIHFWSGAAGVNLKEQATIAFGWPDEWETQFKQAQKDFPNVKY
ncbi:hypothetical protein GCM10023149_18980 [Mucilaginibacter gynuensis]|uniref:Peptidase n=1 Tax=Mucilaginibacter gynuensis TaxID=1302236 RepID=A0ABP8G9Y8_9SPHI